MNIISRWRLKIPFLRKDKSKMFKRLRSRFAENPTKGARRRWTLMAFLAGLTIGLLVSPKTGRGSRAWIRQQFESASANLRRLRQDLVKRTEYQRGRVIGIVHNIRERLAREEETELSDDVINQRVKTALGESPKTYHLPRFNVDTVDGIVTLRGHDENERVKHDVEEVARKIKGVRDVTSKITVGPLREAKDKPA